MPGTPGAAGASGSSTSGAFSGDAAEEVPGRETAAAAGPAWRRGSGGRVAAPGFLFFAFGFFACAMALMMNSADSGNLDGKYEPAINPLNGHAEA
jgi:hypothetical protein